MTEFIKINKEDWILGLETVRKEYKLIFPIKKQNGYEFDSSSENKFIDFQYNNTITSPKKFLFPQSEEIISFMFNKKFKVNNDNIKTSKNNTYPLAIVGIRPCDAKANLILKMNFDTNEVSDPYWLKSYNYTTFIGFACDTPPYSTCFCHSSNSNPYDESGLDILLFTDNKNNYFAKVLTKKGQSFLIKAKWDNLPKEKNISLKDRKNNAIKKLYSKISTDKLNNLPVLTIHKASFWKKIAYSCLSCGICTFVCPTCWCFDIQDEVNGKHGKRTKNWDSCMFPIFTLHTTGHNPRKTTLERIRQRFMHKLKYFLDKYKIGIMCVGCGRCIRSCPVNIDIIEVCNLINNIKLDNTCNKKMENDCE